MPDPDRLDEVVGLTARDTAGGWRSPNTLTASVSPDSAMLQASMSIEAVHLGRDRRRFLGGDLEPASVDDDRRLDRRQVQLLLARRTRLTTASPPWSSPPIGVPVLDPGGFQ